MLEEKVAEIEKRLGRRIKEVEKRLDEVGRRIDTAVDRVTGSTISEDTGHKRGNGGSHLFWGIVFLAAGLIWLGNNLGWFYADVPWVPILLIAGGVTLIIRHAATESREDDR